MRVNLTLVVSMLLCTLFPVPALATTAGGELVNTNPEKKVENPPALAGIAVLVVRREGVSDGVASEFARHVADAMIAAGINITFGPEDGARKLKGFDIVDTAFCKGAPKCAAFLGSKLGVATVVAVQVDAPSKTLAGYIEVVSTADKLSHLSHGISVLKADLKSGPFEGLDEFIKKMKDGLNQPSQPSTVAVTTPPNTAVTASKPNTVAPMPNTVVTPPNNTTTTTTPVVTTATVSTEPPKKSKLLTIMGASVGGVGLVGVGLGAMFSINAKSDYDKAKSANSIDRAEFDSRKQSGMANSERATACLAIGSAALAAGVIMIVTDAVRPSEPSKPVSSASVVFTGNGVGLAVTFP